MLSERQYSDTRNLIASNKINEAINMAVAASDNKSSKNGAWGALTEFHELCEDNNMQLPSVWDWAGHDPWPDTEKWNENARRFFNKKEKVYIFYWEVGKPFPEVDANFYNMSKDAHGFAVVASKNKMALNKIRISDYQYLLGNHGEIKEI